MIRQFNFAAFMFLGFLTGLAMMFSYIASSAYILSNLPAIYAMYACTLSSVVVTVFLSFFTLRGIKVAVFTVFSMLFLAVVMSGIMLISWDVKLQAFLWYSFTLLVSLYGMWLFGELRLSHLNPVMAQEYMPYFSAAGSFAAVMVVLVMHLYPDLPPQSIMKIVLFLYVLVAAVIAVIFVPGYNREIRYELQEKTGKEIKLKGFGWVLALFAAIAFFCGSYEFLIDYILSVMLRERFGSYEEIERVFSYIMVALSLFNVASSPFTSRYISHRHPSPVMFLSLNAVLMGTVSLYSYYSISDYYIIFFFVFSSVCLGFFYLQSSFMIGAALPGRYRARLRAVEEMFYSLAPFALLSGFFTLFFVEAPYEQLMRVLFSMVVAGSLVLCVVLLYFRRFFTHLMYVMLNLTRSNTALLAVDELSFLRPSDFTDKMMAILKKHPTTLLRKTVVVALGYERSSLSEEQIIKEFVSDKEEIQFAVLDALRYHRDYKTIMFLIGILQGRHVSRSIKVKMNAAMLLGKIYGRQSIPVLLQGLEDQKDERMHANIIEVLALFKEKTLIEVFEQYTHSSVNRVRANALMALFYFPSRRADCRKGILHMLQSKDPMKISSALYVVGRTKDKWFLTFLRALLTAKVMEDSMVKRNMAWALLQLRQEDGYRLFLELFAEPRKEGMQADFLHFFSQLRPALRFRFLEYVMHHPQFTRKNLVNLKQHLRHAVFDFHGELEFIEAAGSVH